jgi:hypothetical protein
MHIFRHNFLSNYWWHKSDIWSQASYWCWEKCNKKYLGRTEVKQYTPLPLRAYMFNVYKNQQSRQTGSRNLMGLKTLPTIWGIYMKLVTKYQISPIRQESDIWSQASYRYAILWEAFLDPSDSYFLFTDLVGFYTHWTCACTTIIDISPRIFSLRNKFINQIRVPGGHIQITIMIDTQHQYIKLNIRGEISIIVVQAHVQCV